MLPRLLLPLVVIGGGGAGASLLYQRRRRQAIAQYDQLYVQNRRDTTLLALASSFQASRQDAERKGQVNAQMQEQVIASMAPLQRQLASLKQEEQSHADDVKRTRANNAMVETELKQADKWSRMWLDERKRQALRAADKHLSALNEEAHKEYRERCASNAASVEQLNKGTLESLTESAKRAELALLLTSVKGVDTGK